VVGHRVDIPALLSRIAFVLGTVFVLYPLSSLLFTSLKTESAYAEDPTGLPSSLEIANYGHVWEVARIPSSFMNSAVITITSVVGQIVVAVLASYALCKMRFRRSSFFMLLFLLPITFSPQLLILPLFMQFRPLGLVNARLGLVIIYIAGGLPLSILLFTRFMQTIPIELSESAFLDGASHARTLAAVIMPLLGAVVATNVIISGLSVWNDFFLPFIFLTTEKIRTLPLGIHSFTKQYGNQWTLIATDLVYIVVPVVLVYIFLQRYIIKGVTAGAVKG
jgi:raffinose/stachyose/melibiose transport system permease protein